MNTIAQHNTAGNLLTKKQFAEKLGISIRTIENLVQAGELPAGVRIGRYVYWSESVVAKWHGRLFAEQLGWSPMGV